MTSSTYVSVSHTHDLYPCMHASKLDWWYTKNTLNDLGNYATPRIKTMHAEYILELHTDEIIVFPMPATGWECNKQQMPACGHWSTYCTNCEKLNCLACYTELLICKTESVLIKRKLYLAIVVHKIYTLYLLTASISGRNYKSM